MNKLMTLQSMLRWAPALLLAVSVQVSATDAGSVLFATGPVSAEREPAVTLAKGDTVFVSDTIATGNSARAQLLMLDGAKIAIRPNSRLRIEEFLYSGPNAENGQPVISASDERSVASLLKGGFRTITGAIGKENEASYEVRTPVGVLGIRGTDYAMVFCKGDCNWVPGASAGSPIEDGLYLGVTAGTIVFRNESGEIELSAGEFAVVPLSDRQPRGLAAPPSVLLDENDLLSTDDNGDTSPPPDAGPQTGFDSTLGTRRAPDLSGAQDADGSDNNSGTNGTNDHDSPAQPVIAIDPDGNPFDITPANPGPKGNRTISFSTGSLGAADPGFSATIENGPGEFLLNSANNLLGFEGPLPLQNSVLPASYAIGSASNIDTGFDSMTVLRWGRWSGGVARITTPDGNVGTLDLSSQSLHWVSGPDSSSAPVMPITGIANYSLIGNTSPTDNLGNVGVLGSATFQADFTRQFVTSSLTLVINNSTWSAIGSGPIGSGPIGAAGPLPAHLFVGFYDIVEINGVPGGLGMFSGFFSDPGNASDPSFPGGVGMTYSLLDPGTTTEVSGALVFGNP